MKGIGLYGNDFFKIKEDKELIIESVKRILLTSPGEYINDLDFGCRLKEYIFEFENILLEDIEQIITSALLKWEPRITVSNISVSIDDIAKDKVNVLVIFAINKTFEKITLEISL